MEKRFYNTNKVINKSDKKCSCELKRHGTLYDVSCHGGCFPRFSTLFSKSYLQKKNNKFKKAWHVILVFFFFDKNTQIVRMIG